MRLKYLIHLALLVSISAQAQTSKPKFTSSIIAGLVDGQSGPAASLQTINGIKHQGWSAGVGVGLDYYHVRSVPVFLDIRKNILDKEKTPFIYVGGGYNFPWLTGEQKVYNYGESKGGVYYDAGIGYAMPVLKKSSLFFTAGYSVKQLTISSGMPVELYSSFIPPFSITEYSLRRISVKAGLSF